MLFGGVVFPARVIAYVPVFVLGTVCHESITRPLVSAGLDDLKTATESLDRMIVMFTVSDGRYPPP